MLGERIGDRSQALNWDIWNYYRVSFLLGLCLLSLLAVPWGDWKSEKRLVIQFKVKNLSLFLSHLSTVFLSTEDHQIFDIRYLITCPFITMSLYYSRIIWNYWLSGDGKGNLPGINNSFLIHNFFHSPRDLISM